MRRICASMGVPQSSLSRNRWVSTFPACWTMMRNSSYFLGESFTCLPRNFTIRRTRSADISPSVKIGPFALDLELMSKGRPDTGEQFPHAEGLGDVIVRAEIEGLDLGNFVAAA